MLALTGLGWQNAIDFLVLAVTLYLVLAWAKDARALRIVLAIAGLHAAALLARHYELIITGWVLEGAALVVILLLVVLFQPELRRAVMRLDTRLRVWTKRTAVLESAYDAVGVAAFSMARSRTGALIVFAREQSLHELVDGGVALGAEITPEIIQAIFQKPSPLHDGAVLIEGDRITRANVVLPLTQRPGVPKAFGTRHRAAMGLAERSDAIVLVVSEEHGEVRLVRGRGIRSMASSAELLEALLGASRRQPAGFLIRLRRALTSRIRLKLAAVGLAAVIWSMSFLTSAVVRIVSVPVEFSNLPPGMEITASSGDTLEVELRGSAWLINTLDLSGLVARFDLAGAHQGLQVIGVRPGAVELPPGVFADWMVPSALSVRIEPIRTQQSSPAPPSG
jgi:diadenylate cyclase